MCQCPFCFLGTRMICVGRLAVCEMVVGTRRVCVSAIFVSSARVWLSPMWLATGSHLPLKAKSSTRFFVSSRTNKRHHHHHVPAPVARFARKVITLLHESLPQGKWSLSRYENLTPVWEKFDGLKICQEFASYTELRESAIDLLLGRDTNTQRNHPVFLELLHLPPFACFQPRPRVTLKLACWLQEWEFKFWQ